MTSRIPETEKFRAARDAWADGQGGRLESAWQAAGGFGADEGNKANARKARAKMLAWERGREITSPATYETGGVPDLVSYRTTKHGKQVEIRDSALSVEGLGPALDAMTDEFMRAAQVEADKQVASAAFDIWRDAPVYSGRWRSSLALAWGVAAAGVEVRLMTGAGYTFGAQSTSRAWAAARKRWNQTPERIGSAIKVAKVGR